VISKRLDKKITLSIPSYFQPHSYKLQINLHNGGGGGCGDGGGGGGGGGSSSSSKNNKSTLVWENKFLSSPVLMCELLEERSKNAKRKDITLS
jgi:hypothetical protein